MWWCRGNVRELEDCETLLWPSLRWCLPPSPPPAVSASYRGESCHFTHPTSPAACFSSLASATIRCDCPSLTIALRVCGFCSFPSADSEYPIVFPRKTRSSCRPRIRTQPPALSRIVFPSNTFRCAPIASSSRRNANPAPLLPVIRLPRKRLSLSLCPIEIPTPPLPAVSLASKSPCCTRQQT